MLKTYSIKTNRGTQEAAGDKFFCDLCGFMLKSQEDFLLNSEYFCCHECYLEFAESRKEKWKKGWRPKKVDVNKYINRRKRLITIKGRVK
jgi:hypothetical protein